MNYHKTVQDIKNLLFKSNCWFEVFEHEPVRTSEQAAQVRTGYSLAQGAKAIILRVKKNNEKKFVMLVLPGDQKFDKKKIKALFETDDFRFATESEVIELTGGVLPGGIPPFGNLFGFDVFADPKVFENEKIIFNAGDKRISLAMKSADYKLVVNPKVASII